MQDHSAKPQCPAVYLPRKTAVDGSEFIGYVFRPVCGGVAQLVRALPCHGRGYGFEPRRSRHSFLDSARLYLTQPGPAEH